MNRGLTRNGLLVYYIMRWFPRWPSFSIKGSLCGTPGWKQCMKRAYQCSNFIQKNWFSTGGFRLSNSRLCLSCSCNSPRNNPPVSSPGQSYWAELRESAGVALSLPETGMITAIDLGEQSNVHCKGNKQDGSRLSLFGKRARFYPAMRFTQQDGIFKVQHGRTCTLNLKNVGSRT